MQIKKIDLISDKVLTIVWDDGHESLYYADHLRANCPCASCSPEAQSSEQESNNNGLFKKLQLDKKDVTIVSFEMVGRYAVNFTFSDGHNTGIYSYELLRKLCQCDFCTGNVIRIQGPMFSG